MAHPTTPRLRQVVRRPGDVRAPGARIEGLRRIVVARDDRLGDVVLTLPAVHALRRAYPGARLALMLRRELHPLGRMVRGVDDLIVAPGGVAGARRRLSRYGADLLVCVSRGHTIPVAGALLGIRHRIGTGYRFYSSLFTRRVDERRRAGERHEVEYALSFAHRAGAPGGTARFPIDVPAEARDETDAWLVRHEVPDRFVLIHPGTGGSCPAWPPGRFVELAATLVARGVSVVFSVGPADAAVAEALGRAPAAVRVLPRSSAGVAGLAALTLRAAEVVSNSTGPLHLAAALGVSTLGLFAPWATCGVARWGPYAANGWAWVAENEAASEWSRSRRRLGGEGLLAAIPAEVVAETVVSILRRDPISRP